MENAPRSTQRRIRHTRTTRALIWLMAIALVAAVVLLVSSAVAAGSTVEVSIDTIHRGDPGDLFHEATIEAVGACTATLRYDNNEPDASDHPDTDILVGPITFTNVEQGPFMEAALTFTGTGPTDVKTRIGGDGVSSGGFILEVTCPTTTTTEVPTTTTTVPTTTTSSTVPDSTTTTTQEPPSPTTTVTDTTTSTSVPPAPTTTEPPPIDGPNTGGGACADGACTIGTFTLSPATTWLLLGGVVLAIAAAVLVWAFARAGKDTPTG